MSNGIPLPQANDEKRILFSIRMVKYALCWLLLWQGGMIADSIIELTTLIPVLPYWMTIMEALGTLLLLVVIIERTLTLDFTIRRSYFAGPLILIAMAFYTSWC